MLLQHGRQQRRLKKTAYYLREAANQSSAGRSSAANGVLESLLQDVFVKNTGKYPGAPPLFINQLADYIHLTRSFYSDTVKQETILFEAKALKPSLLPASLWLLLCRVCQENGQFILGNTFRNKAIMNVHEISHSRKATHKEISHALRASLDQCDNDASLHLLQKLKNKLVSKGKFNAFSRFMEITGFISSQHVQLEKSYEDVNDTSYSNLITGRSIAVLGPAPSEINLEEVYKHYDVVVKLNYKGHNHFSSFSKSSQQTLVSYYNSENALKVHDDNNFQFFNDLRFSCYRVIKHDFQKNLSKQKKARVMYSPNYFLFNGQAQLVQNTVYDLLFFEPKKIKLFNINFFTSKTPYRQNYSINDERKDRLWRFQSFANHDLISQLNFVRNLFKNNRIEVDDECLEVIKMTDQKYLAVIEDNFTRK